jgi:hypothetical protein
VGACRPFLQLVAFYITQSVLVRIRNVKLHRTIGWAGVALGTSMVVVGFWVAVVMARFDTNQLHRANRDALLDLVRQGGGQLSHRRHPVYVRELRLGLRSRSRS